jgi:hypothetical protein
MIQHLHDSSRICSELCEEIVIGPGREGPLTQQLV